MRYLIACSLSLLLAACGAESTSSPAAEFNEDSLHQRDRTDTDAPQDTLAAGHGHHETTGSGGMAGLMQQNMQAMMQQPSRGDADQDFAALMRVHHQGAVDMARLELQQGSDAQLKSMAQSITGSQQKEIATLEAYLQQHPAGSGESDYYKQSMQEMKGMQHGGNGSGNVDKDFAQLMIPHHRHGVMMAQGYLKVAKDPGLKTLAQNIIRDQQREIGVLEQWVKAHP
ncbi:MAG: DUF305 domain-containing protein [Chitinophagaceae bacterium]|nr:MAG: DUF305 domain-containing protein [Chitinophagaceae bacterium]